MKVVLEQFAHWSFTSHEMMKELVSCTQESIFVGKFSLAVIIQYPF